jgi:transcriptional regulator with XRE-family HTH domain
MAKTQRAKTPKTVSKTKAGDSVAVPQMIDVGEIIKRLRTQRGLSIQDVAEGCGLSPSFLSTVERGNSDISLGRLAQVAAFFRHDVGSLLGYKAALSRPQFVEPRDRTKINRGPGIEYEAVRLPGLDLEIDLMSFEPKSAMKDALVHEGVDVVLVTSGEVIVCIGEDEYRMRAGECAVYSATNSHRIRNDSNRKAVVIGITTARMASIL